MGYLMLIFKNEKLIDRFNSPIQYIYQLKGCFYLHPVISISLCISLFSFIGIPPLIGFYGKQLILSAAIDAKKYFLVLLIIITSVISAIYYLNLIKLKFFIPPKKNLVFSNLKLGLNIKDFLINTFFFTKIIFNVEKIKLEKVKYNKVLYTLSTNISIFIVILTILSIIYIYIHERIIILINIISLHLF
jgi:NADH-ubiquinone oxidoreductase chain 2